VATLDDDDRTGDHEATWLLGHTERISFRNLRRAGNQLLVDATLHVRCRHLDGAGRRQGSRGLTCRAHGFDNIPAATQAAPQPRRLGGDQFALVEAGRLEPREVPLPRRALPVLADDLDGLNPCSIAPCTTADHTRGSACCRDLQIEILCPASDTSLEALIRSRLSPYLCKLTRENPDALEGEIISACGYLDESGLNCSLHDRLRSDGRPAKPDLCSQWPDDGKGAHPGCIFQ
jgi:hypothetical protein